MSILIKKGGILTTIQDQGRLGYRRFGINSGGVMDQAAVRLINILAGNNEREAVIETHFPALEIVFESTTIFAVGGADLAPHLDGEALQNWRPYIANEGSTLKFSNKVSGERAYLIVHGGFEIDEWLGSESTNMAAKIGGFEGRKLAPGDRIELKTKIRVPSSFTTRKISSSLIPKYGRFPTIRIIAGAEFEYLDEKSRDLLINQNYAVSANSDRMGFRLSGDAVTLSEPREFISSAVSFGTIQLLPDGQLIVLMADHQTSGGYPRIGHAITHDLPLLAQLGAGDKVAFHLIEHAEAERMLLGFERELNFFRIGCRFQANSWRR